MRLLGSLCASRYVCIYWGQCMLVGAYALFGSMCANSCICTYLVNVC